MKNYTRGFASVVLLTLIALGALGAGAYIYKTHTGKNSAPIVIKDSGSTNTGAYTLTVNSDGSGTKDFKGDQNTEASITHYPAGTFDYKRLVQSIEHVPDLKFTTNCAKSASFGTTQTLIYKGETSGDLTCMPQTEAYKNLSATIGNIEETADCYDPKNTSGMCQEFRAQQTSTVDSGIIANVSVTPIPGCQSPANLREGEFHPCALGPYQATFSLSQSNGTFVKKVSTDSNGQFTVALPPGDYVLTDVSAGTSNEPHSFFDANALYHGTLGSTTDAKVSYMISIPAHEFVHVSPWFDGNSFK